MRFDDEKDFFVCYTFIVHLILFNLFYKRSGDESGTNCYKIDFFLDFLIFSF